MISFLAQSRSPIVDKFLHMVERLNERLENQGLETVYGGELFLLMYGTWAKICWEMAGDEY